MKKIVRLAVVLCAGLCLLPVASVFVNSVTAQGKVLLFPGGLTLGKYMGLFFESVEYLYRFWYSLALALLIALLQLVTSFLIASGMVHVRAKTRVAALYIVVLFMTMPFQVTLLPNYLLSRWLHIYDTVWAMIVPQIFSPLGIFLLHQSLAGMPAELSDVAVLETNSYGKYSWHVALSYVKPTVVALGVLLFADAWGMVDIPLFLLRSEQLYPLSLLLNRLSAEEASVAFAAAVLYMAPVLLIYGFLRSNIIDGFITVPTGGSYEEK